MNQLYVVFDRRSLSPVSLTHNKCLHLVSYAPTHILSTDLKEWEKTADHLSVFTINTRLHVICLDLEKLLPP